MPKHRIAIFVHGCFWHQHPDCRLAYSPKSNSSFWASKFNATVARDRVKAEALRTAGWKVFTIWECAIDEDVAGASRRVVNGIRRD